MCLTDDLWKSIQLLKNLSNPDSLYNRFGCGSAETLKSDQLSLKLLEFNKRHYSSNLMKLCIYSNESLELLELWAKELFSPVPNFSLQKRDMNLSPKAFENGKNMKNFLQIIPVKDKDLIELIWIVNENLHKYYKTKPEHLIGHLFGHEGTNSLLAFLKEKNLATALSFSSEVELDSFALFIISIELTKKGFDRYEDVCEIVFCYLKKIQGKSYEDWKNLFEECSKIEELTFLYADKMKEIRYVSKMVNDMQLYPVKNIIDGGYRMENFDFELIMRILKNFTIDNLIIFFSSKNFQFKTNNIEKYFKTQYNCHEINEEIKQKFINPKMDMFDCKKILDFPLKNIFIPQFFSIIPDEKIWDQPKKIHESEFSTLWLKQGSSFKLPKVVIELKIYTDGFIKYNYY